MQRPTSSSQYSTQQNRHSNNSNAENNRANNQETTPEPIQIVPQFTDEDLINICDSAIRAKYTWALVREKVGQAASPPTVERFPDGTYRVNGTRLGGVNFYIVTSCTIDSNGIVTNIER